MRPARPLMMLQNPSASCGTMVHCSPTSTAACVAVSVHCELSASIVNDVGKTKTKQ